MLTFLFYSQDMSYQGPDYTKHVFCSERRLFYLFSIGSDALCQTKFRVLYLISQTECVFSFENRNAKM